MILALHGLTTMHCNIKTDIRIARETGYDGLEVVVSKLLRYMDCGFKVADLVPIFERHAIRPVGFNTMMGLERNDDAGRRDLLNQTERLCIAAAVLKCPTIQLLGFYGHATCPWPEARKIAATNVAHIADIGKQHGVRFQLEPIAWSPLHSLSQGLEVIAEAGRDNVGMVIDFWHLWAGGETTPDDVTRLSASQIYGIHFCDGIRHTEGEKWVEENLRGFLPGDGDIPVQEWVDAVRATGFDGSWSCELYSPKHWEWDTLDIARECKTRMQSYLE